MLIVIVTCVLIFQGDSSVGYEIDSGACGVPRVSRGIGRIINGNISSPGSWPWQVLLQRDGDFICGGTLISEQYILTAAHCIVSGMSSLSLHVGAHKFDASDSTALEVKAHVVGIHEDYDTTTLAFDICLIKLVSPVTFTPYIQPVCMPTFQTKLTTGDDVYVTGWGYTGKEYAEYLNEAKVLVIDRDDCVQWYSEVPIQPITIPENHFCAGFQQGEVDTCDGDSGGPLVHQETSESDKTAYILRGITSFGYGCALEERPGVYVRVSDFRNWVDDKIANLSKPSCQPTESDVCGGIVSAPTIIRNPSTPRNFAYPPNQNCVWNIQAPVGQTIRFNFVCYFLLTPPGESCNDYVSITDHTGKEKKFCGNQIPDPHFVNGSSATLTFITSEANDFPGFVVEIQFSSTNPLVDPTASTNISAGECGVSQISQGNERIINGNVSSPGKWPWQVLLQRDGDFICGGTLISDRHILTAAHCIVTGVSRLSLHVGAYNSDASDSTSVEVYAHAIICHESYNTIPYDSDLCLIKLRNPVGFTSYIIPACLPPFETKMSVGDEVFVTGWGRTGAGYAEYLNEAKVTVLDKDNCEAWYSEVFLTVPDNHLCAGFQEGEVDTCDGDSGGPLVREEITRANHKAYVLRGITSFGYGCAMRERPGVYVRVSDFRNWIDDKIETLSAPSCQPTESEICGGIVNTPAIVRNPTTTRNFAYPPDQNCLWDIEAPFGHTIVFNFICYFLLSPPGEICDDYISITNSEGYEEKFCGNEIPDPYRTNGRNASLRFVSSGANDFPGFVVDVQFSSTTSTLPTSTQTTAISETSEIITTAVPSTKNPTTIMSITPDISTHDDGTPHKFSTAFTSSQDTPTTKVHISTEAETSTVVTTTVLSTDSPTTVTTTDIKYTTADFVTTSHDTSTTRVRVSTNAETSTIATTTVAITENPTTMTTTTADSSSTAYSSYHATESTSVSTFIEKTTASDTTDISTSIPITSTNSLTTPHIFSRTSTSSQFTTSTTTMSTVSSTSTADNTNTTRGIYISTKNVRETDVTSSTTRPDVTSINTLSTTTDGSASTSTTVVQKNTTSVEVASDPMKTSMSVTVSTSQSYTNTNNITGIQGINTTIKIGTSGHAASNGVTPTILLPDLTNTTEANLTSYSFTTDANWTYTNETTAGAVSIMNVALHTIFICLTIALVF